MNLISIVQQTSILSSLILASSLIFSSPIRAAERTCVITDEGATVCGKLLPPKPGSQKSKPSSEYIKKVGNFTIELKGCKKDDSSVICIFQIANKGADKLLQSSPSNSYMIDANGKSYRAVTIDMGGRVTEYIGEAIVVSGIDYFASITIKNVPEQLTRAKLVEFNTNLDKVVQFRNVPLSN